MQQDKKYVILILELTHRLGPAQTESLLQSQELSLGSVPGLCSSHKTFFLQHREENQRSSWKFDNFEVECINY